MALLWSPAILTLDWSSFRGCCGVQQTQSACSAQGRGAQSTSCPHPSPSERYGGTEKLTRTRGIAVVPLGCHLLCLHARGQIKALTLTCAHSQLEALHASSLVSSMRLWMRHWGCPSFTHGQARALRGGWPPQGHTAGGKEHRHLTLVSAALTLRSLISQPAPLPYLK